MKMLKYKILLFFSLTSLIASIILSIPGQASDYCAFKPSDCSFVHFSKYNYTLGVQNSYYGIIVFTLLSFIIFLQIRNPSNKKRLIIHSSIFLGSLISLYFLYLQYFILRAYCLYCLVIDLSLLFSLLLILIRWGE